VTLDEAIEIVALYVLADLAYTGLADAWGDYPEIGEHDWRLVYNRVNRLIPNPGAGVRFREAYAFLEDRADREVS
jgi:hypothetical protein